VLPFGAPDVLGQTTVDGRSALVQTLLPGYRVDAAHVPAGGASPPLWPPRSRRSTIFR
jgi:hypothetical protein